MSSKAKILVVEDEPGAAALMTFLLTRADCDVKTVFNGRNGLEVAKSEKFDLIILDVYLPAINGLEICGELKQRHISRRTPICFVSGRPTMENIQRAFELGAADFIEKPFGASDFVSRILSLVKETVLT